MDVEPSPAELDAAMTAASLAITTANDRASAEAAALNDAAEDREPDSGYEAARQKRDAAEAMQPNTARVDEATARS